MFLSHGPLAGLACLLLGASASAQVHYATTVVQFNQGPGPGLFDPSLILGGPQGGIGTDVLSLGMGGDVTLGFGVVISDGPGADFVVYENPFEWMQQTFAEVALVEVSTNGVDFARFPLRYDGPQGPLGAFEMLPWGSYSGMTGHVPAIANVLTNSLDPRDPVDAGGEAFDLNDLSAHPLVLAGQVDLATINYIRLVDLVAGTVLDDRLVPIWDSGGADGSADIDAVAVVNHQGMLNPSGPVLNLWRDSLGYVWLDLSDPNGFGDLDLGTLRMSVNLVPTSFGRLRDYFVLSQASPTGLLLRSPLPMFLENHQAVLALSIVDSTGLFATDQISLNR